MFSAALEMVLNVAVREAIARRHGHLTLEHLLYAVANHPAGEEILRACGVDLDRLRADLARYLEDSIERLAQGQRAGAGADPRVPPCAPDGCPARPERGREEAHIGTCWPRSSSSPARRPPSSWPPTASPGSTSSTTSATASARCPHPDAAPENEESAHAGADESPGSARDPLQAYAVKPDGAGAQRPARSS